MDLIISDLQLDKYVDKMEVDCSYTSRLGFEQLHKFMNKILFARKT